VADNGYTTKPRAGIGYLIVYSDMQDSPAFNAMRPLAQLLVMKVKRFYDRKTQAAVRVSERTAAKLTGTSRKTARSLCKEAVHYGVWRHHTAGYLGSKGKGIASSYQLTDEKFRGKPATLDFLRWDGTLFHEQHTPAYDRRQARSLARLMAFKARQPVSARGKNNHKKTESRPRHTPNPELCVKTTPGLDTHPGSSKVQQNPGLDTHPISREKLSVSTVSERVTLVLVPLTAPRHRSKAENQQRQRQQDAKKAEQDLVEMIIVLRRFLGNAATNADWQRHMQNHGKAGWSRSAFVRRLRILKAREWIRIVGNTDPIVDRIRVSKGSLFEATEKAPGALTPLVSDQYRDGDIGKAAMEQLERLKRGKLPAA